VPVRVVAALLPGPAAAELHVEVGQVQLKQLVRSGAPSVGHAPQDPFTQAEAVIDEQPFQPGSGDGLVTVAGHLAALQPPARVGGQPVLPPRVRGKGVERGQVHVPGVRRPLSKRAITAQ
jgi:hypothetical protein